MIKVKCRQCREKLEASESMRGQVIECPKCGTNSRIDPDISELTSKLADSQTSRRNKASSGMFDAVLGNATELSPEEASTEVGQLLVANERVELSYKLVRDMFVFTDRRLLLVDKQGITGKKIEYHSIPYKSITHFSVETAGTLDRDAELKIFVSGNPDPIHKQFRKNGANIFDVQKALATAILT